MPFPPRPSGVDRLPVFAQFALHQQGEIPKPREVSVIGRVRLGVENAQRSYAFTAKRLQRIAGIEADVWVVDNERVVAESLVLQGVRNYHPSSLTDSGVAERPDPWQLDERGPRSAADPLGAAIKHGESCRRNLERCLSDVQEALDCGRHQDLREIERVDCILPICLCPVMVVGEGTVRVIG